MKKLVFFICVIFCSCNTQSQMDPNKAWIIYNKHLASNDYKASLCKYYYTDGTVNSTFEDSCYLYKIGDTLNK